MRQDFFHNVGTLSKALKFRSSSIVCMVSSGKYLEKLKLKLEIDSNSFPIASTLNNFEAIFSMSSTDWKLIENMNYIWNGLRHCQHSYGHQMFKKS